MASYKIYTHSLADQAANLADVYSSVPAVPIAKEAIKRQARKGLVSREGIQVPVLASLVDGYLLYRDWWVDEPTAFNDRTLKNVFRDSLGRRGMRLQKSDEPSRAIEGRPTLVDSPTTYEITSDKENYPSDGIRTVVIKVTPVYADGSYPYEFSADLTQSLDQEVLFGIEILDGAGTISGNSVSYTFTVDPDSGSTGARDIQSLNFTLTMQANEVALDDYGNEILTLPGSISTGTEAITVSLP